MKAMTSKTKGIIVSLLFSYLTMLLQIKLNMLSKLNII